MDDARVREFCARLYAELKAGYWGSIDPYLFEMIANGETELTEDAAASMASLKDAVAKALDA
jgi:hypothetical protein